MAYTILPERTGNLPWSELVTYWRELVTYPIRTCNLHHSNLYLIF